MSRQHLFLSKRLSGALLPSLCAVSLLALAAPAHAQTTCSPVAVSAITASADDGNAPTNVLDGNTGTRWSCNGIGCWIRADLGASKQVSAVDLTWYAGDQRNNNYVVSISPDGATWYTAASGLSDRSLQAQRVSFTPVTARYVKVTVNGNTTNNWASLTELRVLDCGAATPPPPDTAPGKDPFGVTMLYPSKPGGESWFESTDPTRDSRFDPQDTITRNADGSWKMKSTKVRMSVFTSTGYIPSHITTYNRETLASRGYMQDPNDWKNIEMTGFVKVNSAADLTDNFAWYARGGRHTDSLACEGSSYKGGLHYNGRARWEKESWHVSYDQTAYKNVTTSLKGRWVGFKAVMRNTTVSGKPAVHLEMYLNDNADKVTWNKIYDVIDSGNWGGDATHCGASSDPMPMTWGGPIAVFRWDSATDVDFKWLSVREIQP